MWKGLGWLSMKRTAIDECYVGSVICAERNVVDGALVRLER